LSNLNLHLFHILVTRTVAKKTNTQNLVYFLSIHQCAYEKINVREHLWDNSKNYNPEKLAAYGTQDEEKQSKNTTQ